MWTTPSHSPAHFTRSPQGFLSGILISTTAACLLLPQDSQEAERHTRRRRSNINGKLSQSAIDASKQRERCNTSEKTDAGSPGVCPHLHEECQVRQGAHLGLYGGA